MFESYHELIEISEYVSVEELLANGFDARKPDSDGIYVLDPVCKALKFELAKRLVEAGADVNSKSSDSFTPLLSAIDCAHHNPPTSVKLVSFLLDSGADIEGRGDWDKTPFLKSCTRGVIDLTRLLVERGCNTKATAEELDGPMGAVDFADMPTNSPEFRRYISELSHS